MPRPSPNPACRPVPECVPKESQHLIERPGKMNRGALRENFRALAVAAEPEAEAAQQEVRVRRRRIAAVQREARQHARWLGEAAGFRDLLGLIRGGIGAPNASAPGKARACPWPQTGCRLQGVDNGCGRGSAAGKPGQAEPWVRTLGLCFWRRASQASFPKRPCLVRFCDETCRWQLARSGTPFLSGVAQSSQFTGVSGGRLSALNAAFAAAPRLRSNPELARIVSSKIDHGPPCGAEK